MCRRNTFCFRYVIVNNLHNMADKYNNNNKYNNVLLTLSVIINIMSVEVIN
jgi:hypothetical protein